MVGLPTALVAQAPELPPTPTLGDRHAWAQFGVGSWKLVRVYTETLSESGDVASVSITETKTTLDQVDEKGYALKVEVTVEVAGKRFQAEPKYVAYGYHGELGPMLLAIEGEATKSISTVEYTNAVAPYFLKCTTESINSETQTPNYHSVVEVIAVDMPEKVLTEVKSAAHVKTIETFENGSSKVTLEVHCDSVPGGVVSHTSRQVGADHRVTRSTLELLDYEALSKAPEDERSTKARRGLFQRRRQK